jgi:hypothetical protein
MRTAPDNHAISTALIPVKEMATAGIRGAGRADGAGRTAIGRTAIGAAARTAGCAARSLRSS